MRDRITGHTVLTGLLGTPVGHSISPMMHNEGFRQLGLDYVYLAFDVNEKNLEKAITGLKALNVRGFNVTMPCKNDVVKYCDKLSMAAEISGAVNTVVNDGGILTGHTTDGTGYMQAVVDAGHDIIGKKITLLGAGGAATSILVQAAIDGVAEIAVFSLRDQFYPRAESIVAQLNERTNCKVRLYDFSDEQVLKQEISSSALLVNGTSVGMSPNEDACIIKDALVFHQDLVVSDVIYNPKETKLLRMAKEAGCECFNGLYMLLYQGVEAFRLWTGQDMPVAIIKEKFFKEFQ